ncbi:methylaspartate mutase accessory protein GlmL [Sporomusa sphaeroides DSM 2875]|uniref:methylaspartate mutase accessory protein GlmL n=1 Tax=Sporomusa sphaeroides TaxID=47679 RepID=UPI0020303795|nr:methylaspartate mutase accessory protein GlmL [Sporomusa sphaeroides]MCM0758885.1 methylaspartate mutase accessory protein GlmL [Sporomusa sphaeroides DSM 2875]
MNNVLLIDFGSTYTKITAVDVEQEQVLGTARGITTVETDIMDGLNQALAALTAKTGKLEFEKVLACSSAAGGLKMIAVGLVPEMTAEAAKRAALGAGAKVLKVFTHELNEYEIEEIAGLKPDIILLAGGTDGGNQKVILHNARMLAELGLDVPVVVAGNKSVAPAVVKILSEKLSVVRPTENVMPKLDELNIEPARAVIRDIFLKRITEAKGLNRANKMVDRMVMPTPAAVLRAAELLSQGAGKEPGLGDLMVVDIGGATTDVYSIAKGDPTVGGVNLKGLAEPFGKRTVEGDLGMRYSAGALLKAAGAELIAEFAGVTEAEAAAYVLKVEADIDHLPQTEAEARIEIAMGKACVRLGADRHVGHLTSYFTPMGSTFVQQGKDLTKVTAVIGTGGVIVNNPEPEEILKGILFDEADPLVLKPKEARFPIDKEYIMSAMGLLGEEYPQVAVRMMKKYIVTK